VVPPILEAVKAPYATIGEISDILKRSLESKGAIREVGVRSSESESQNKELREDSPNSEPIGSDLPGRILMARKISVVDCQAGLGRS